jgi:hypothetical protein
MGQVLGLVLLLVGLVLATQRWFWVLLFFTGGLAAGFAVLASIIHFQILFAVAMFFLAAICWGIAGAIADS